MRREHFGSVFVISSPRIELTPNCQFLAIRIYSATVNSMVDERTTSNFTWFNSGLRNRQNVSTLTWMIQIRQWALHLVRLSAPPHKLTSNGLIWRTLAGKKKGCVQKEACCRVL